jgi:serine phosphatase RsbU (regulator of sigma subunit)
VEQMMSANEAGRELHEALIRAKPHLGLYDNIVDAIAAKKQELDALGKEVEETQAQRDKENDALVRDKADFAAQREAQRAEAAEELRELQRKTNEQAAALDAVTAKVAEATREHNSLVAAMQELGLRLRVPAVA